MSVAPPAPALTQGVQALCAALARAQQDFRRYPRNNPLLPRRVQEVLARLEPLLSSRPELRLGVGPDSLIHGGQEVYRSLERTGLSAPLYGAGIRELVLQRGVGAPDVEALLDALSRFHAEGEGGEGDEDLATFLWERRPRGVRWALADELPADARWAADPLGTLGELLAAQHGAPVPDAAARAHAEALAAPPHDPRPAAQAVALTAEQRTALQALREEDTRRDVALGVVEVLLHVLRAGPAPGEREELLRAVGRIVDASLAEGQLRRATSLLRQLRQLVAVEEDPAVAAALREALDAVASDAALQPLFARLRAGWGGVDEGALTDLLNALPPAAAPALTRALGVLEDRRMRRLVCTVVAAQVRDAPERLAPLLEPAAAPGGDGAEGAESWYVARNMAYILGLTRSPAAARLLGGLAAHPHPRVRTEALRALGPLHGRETRALALRALGDPERAVRLQALAVCEGHADAAVAQALLARLRDRGFARLEPEEKRALARAAGRVARDAALADLTHLLQQRGLLGLGRSAADEDRVAAVYGLAASGTPAALALLARAVEEQPALRAAAEQARAELRAPPAEEAT